MLCDTNDVTCFVGTYQMTRSSNIVPVSLNKGKSKPGLKGDGRKVLDHRKREHLEQVAVGGVREQ